MPVVFLGHGNPMNAVETNPYSRAWAGLGRDLPRPRAILAVSAHWYRPGIALTAGEHPPTIHDFSGFPKALFDVDYPAPGSPDLVERVVSLLDPEPATAADRGFDHGAWSVLARLYPDADVPVVQLSVDASRSGPEHLDLAARLRPLRDEGVLIVASGNVVHNLRLLRWSGEGDAHPWAVDFDKEVRRLVESLDGDALARWDSLPGSRHSVPTPEHYLPLLYAVGVADPAERVTVLTEGIEMGSISMLSVRIS